MRNTYYYVCHKAKLKIKEAIKCGSQVLGDSYITSYCNGISI